MASFVYRGFSQRLMVRYHALAAVYSECLHLYPLFLSLAFLKWFSLFFLDLNLSGSQRFPSKAPGLWDSTFSNNYIVWAVCNLETNYLFEHLPVSRKSTSFFTSHLLFQTKVSHFLWKGMSLCVYDTSLIFLILCGEWKPYFIETLLLETLIYGTLTLCT